MKKRIKYASVLAAVVLIATCLYFGSPSLQRARALAQQDGGSAGADRLVWERTLGSVPGQMLRVTVANPGETREPPPLFFLCKVLDQNGVVVFQSARREVPARHFRYEDINFEDLGGVVGEPGTGRRQVMIQVSIQAARGGRTSNVESSLEVINTDTGATAFPIYLEDVQISSFQTSGH